MANRDLGYILEVAKRLPKTDAMIESLSDLSNTVNELLSYVGEQHQEMNNLKSQLIDSINENIKLNKKIILLSNENIEKIDAIEKLEQSIVDVEVESFIYSKKNYEEWLKTIYINKVV